MFLRIRNVIFVLVFVTLVLTTSFASAKEYKVLLHASLACTVGDSVTCLDLKKPRQLTLIFPKQDGKIHVEVTFIDANGKEAVESFTNREGTLPMIDGIIKRVTITFESDGLCDLEVNVIVGNAGKQNPGGVKR